MVQVMIVFDFLMAWKWHTFSMLLDLTMGLCLTKPIVNPGTFVYECLFYTDLYTDYNIKFWIFASSFRWKMVRQCNFHMCLSIVFWLCLRYLYPIYFWKLFLLQLSVFPLARAASWSRWGRPYQFQGHMDILQFFLLALYGFIFIFRPLIHLKIILLSHSMQYRHLLIYNIQLIE